MSDNMRTYKAIRDALKHLYPKDPQGNIARRLNVLAALISGIVESKKVNLPQIADKVPDGNKLESRIKQFYRWITNEGDRFRAVLFAICHSLAGNPCSDYAVSGDGWQQSWQRMYHFDGQCGLQRKSLADCLDCRKGKERSFEGGDSLETD